jgi:hypothetical protein
MKIKIRSILLGSNLVIPFFVRAQEQPSASVQDLADKLSNYRDVETETEMGAAAVDKHSL